MSGESWLSFLRGWSPKLWASPLVHAHGWCPGLCPHPAACLQARSLQASLGLVEARAGFLCCCWGNQGLSRSSSIYILCLVRFGAGSRHKRELQVCQKPASGASLSEVAKAVGDS